MNPLPPLPETPHGFEWTTPRRCPQAVFPVHTTMALLDDPNHGPAGEWVIVRPLDGKWGGSNQAWYVELKEVLHTDAIDRLYLELAQFTRVTTPKDHRQQEKIRQLHGEIRALKWLVHEAATRLETIRETHPSIDTKHLLERLREAVPQEGPGNFTPEP